MSEEASRTPDISKVISVIMENPDILERISSLLSTDSQVQKADTEQASMPSAPTYSPPENEKRARRSQLLSAIKPYVKKERREAIDSVIAIADIIDMMRRG